MPALGAIIKPATALLPRSRAHRGAVSTLIAGYMFEIFLYGIYVVLFIICVLILLNNKPTTRWRLLASATIMFAISTASACLTLYMSLGFLGVGKQIPASAAHPKYSFYVINNAIADSLMISRCYSAWSQTKSIIVLPCLLLVSSTVCGLIFANAPESNPQLRKKIFIYAWSTLSLNVLVTFLIAVRIWWMARQAKKILGPGLARKYYSALAIIIESGAIYSLYILLDRLLRTSVLNVGLTQIVGIVPTLVIVQVGMGRHIRDVETTASLVRAETRRLSMSQVDPCPVSTTSS